MKCSPPKLLQEVSDKLAHPNPMFFVSPCSFAPAHLQSFIDTCLRPANGTVWAAVCGSPKLDLGEMEESGNALAPWSSAVGVRRQLLFTSTPVANEMFTSRETKAKVGLSQG